MNTDFYQNLSYPDEIKSMSPRFITPGTGEMFNKENINELLAWLNFFYELHSHNSLQGSTPDHIDFIRKAFALNLSELALIFDVKRPTIYAWLEGKHHPKHEALNHINELYLAAQKLDNLKISRMDTFINRPLFEGQSLLDKLKKH